MGVVITSQGAGERAGRRALASWRGDQAAIMRETAVAV